MSEEITRASDSLSQWEDDYGRRISELVGSLNTTHRSIIFLTVALLASMEPATSISVNVLLPGLQGNVAGTSDDVSWVLILYNLGYLSSLVIGFWMARVLGFRTQLLLALSLYSAGIVGCVLSSHSLTSLLVARTVMGFGGGAFLVRYILLLRTMFSGKARAAATTAFYIILTSSCVVYPTAMGWISDTFAWNYAFLLDFPVLIIAAYLTLRYIPLIRVRIDSEKSYIDWHGAVLLVISIGGMQVALSRGERDLWFQSPMIDLCLITALACFAGFLWWEWRVENTAPVLHLRVAWKEISLRASLVIVMIAGALLGAGLFVLPQYLRTVQDFSATQTGMILSAYGAGSGIGFLATFHLALARFGGRKVVVGAATLMGVTCISFLYSWTPSTPTWLLLLLVFLQGIAIAGLLLGATNVATGKAAFADLGDIITVFLFLRQLGSTFGLNSVTVLFDRRQTLHSSHLLDVANALNPQVRATLQQNTGIVEHNAGAASNPALGALQIFQSNVIAQSKLLAYMDVYLFLALLSAFILILMVISHAREEGWYLPKLFIRGPRRAPHTR